MTLDEAKEFAAIYHHKFMVAKFLAPIIRDLIKRSEEHDNSKFTEEEFPGLVAAMDDIRKYAYGTSEYNEMRKKHAKTYLAHYRKNRHHPEYHPNGIEGMDLVDLLEMLCDWKSASMRTENGGSIEGSIKIGAEKYNISPQLVKILENTARNYKM